MFPKAARFPTEKPSDVPAPGFYNPKEIDSAPYKRGGLYERSDRNLFGKSSDGPGPSDYQTLNADVRATQARAHPRISIAMSAKGAVYEQQIQLLQAENVRLDKERQQDLHRLEEKLLHAENRAKELVREKTSLQVEATTAQKEQRLATQREAAARAALEKAEAAAKQSNDRAGRYNALQKRLEDLEKLHTESKKKHREEQDALQVEIRRARNLAAEQERQLDQFRRLTEAGDVRLQDLKRAHAEAEKENQTLRLQLSEEKKAKTEHMSTHANKERLEADLRTLKSRHSQETKDLRQKMEAHAAKVEQWKHRLDDAQTSLQKAKGTLSEERRRLTETIAQLDLQRRDAETEQKRLLDQHAEQMFMTQKRIRALEDEIRLSRDRDEQAKEVAISLESRTAIHRSMLLGQLEHVRDVMSRVAKQYGELASFTMKSQSSTNGVETEFIRLRLEAAITDKDAEIRRLELLLERRNEEIALLSSCLEDAESMVDRLLSSRDNSKGASHDNGRASLILSFHSLGLAIHRDCPSTQFLELHQKESIILEDWLRSDRQWIANSYDVAFSALMEVTTDRERLARQLTEQESLCERMRQDVTSLRSERTAANEAVADLEGQLAGANMQICRWETEAGTWQAANKEECSKLHDQIKAERDCARQLASDLAQGKARETALKEDLESLQAALGEAERFEAAYSALLAEVKLVLSRTALAEDEAERLSRFNAEILSHCNPSQKILYVDKIRRELADTKQKLVAAISERDSSQDNVRRLRDELSSYKSIAVPVEIKPRSGMTRVARVPFGSRSVNTLSRPTQAMDGSQAPQAQFRAGDDDGDCPLRIEDLMSTLR